MNIATCIAIAVGTSVVAGFLSAGESAILQVARHRIWARTGLGTPRHERIRGLVERRGAAASASGLIRLVLEAFAAVSITMAIAAFVDEWWLILIIASVLFAVISLIIIRTIPRSLGRSTPERVVFATWRLLWMCVTITHWSTRLLPESSRYEEDSTHAEIQDMVDRIDEDIIIEDEDREMIRSVFELGGTITREVMVARINMVTARPETTLRQAMNLFLRSGFSRIPVIGKNVDDVVGVVYFKDVSRVLHFGADSAGEDQLDERQIREVMREAIFVPESKPVDELLRFLQEARSHLAMVLDEYGGIAGLVTIEDAVEEIVGELTDEHDRYVFEAEEVSPGVYRVPAVLAIDEVGELFDVEVDDDEVDSVGGALAKALGSVPLAGEEADYYGLHLVAESVQGRRKQLATVLVSRSLLPDAEEEHATDTLEENHSQARTGQGQNHG